MEQSSKNNFNPGKQVGVHNLGNTCYLNSLLQLMYQCTLLNVLLLDNKEIFKSLPHFNQNEVTNKYIDFLTTYTNTSDNSCNQDNIHKFIFPTYPHREQQDASEYLNRLIDLLKDIITKIPLYININSKKYDLNKLFHHLFIHTSANTLICTKCNTTKSIANEINTILTLEIPPTSIQQSTIKSTTKSTTESTTPTMSLNTLFDHYEKIEQFDRSEYSACESHKCNGANNIDKKQIKIIYTPKYFIISPKRFQLNFNTGVSQKIHTSIDFPLVLDKCNKKYLLRGFIYHYGEINAGHYVYYGLKPITNLPSSDKTYRWYIHNDEKTTPIGNAFELSEIEEKTSSNIKTLKNTAYVYLYVCMPSDTS